MDMLGKLLGTNTPTMQSKLSNVRLISGRSNPELAKAISDKIGIPLTKIKFRDFGNGEMCPEIEENIRDMHVFIIQTGGGFENRSLSVHFMELMLLIDACKRSSTKSNNVIFPTFAYARSDKRDCRCPIGGSMVATILQTLGVKRIISMDLHAGQIQGFSSDAFDNLYGIKLHIDNLRNTEFKGKTVEQINNEYVLASADVGGAKRIEAYAKKIGMSHVIMHKHRDYAANSVVQGTILVGEANAVKDKTVIVIDDMFDSFGTIDSAAHELVKFGAKRIIAIATHGIFSGQAFDKINSNQYIDKVIVTNTLPQSENKTKSSKLEVVDTSDLFVAVIKCIRTGASISALFD
jgi:ribose-phosphate pyrophosphokinase